MARRRHPCAALGTLTPLSPGEDGVARLVGRLPILRSTDVIVRDIPANHMMSPECVVVVKRRYDN